MFRRKASAISGKSSANTRVEEGPLEARPAGRVDEYVADGAEYDRRAGQGDQDGEGRRSPSLTPRCWSDAGIQGILGAAHGGRSLMNYLKNGTD